MDLIFEVENFISNESCDEIVDWFRQQQKNQVNTGNTLFNNRTIPYSSVKDLKIKSGSPIDLYSKIKNKQNTFLSNVIMHFVILNAFLLHILT